MTEQRKALRHVFDGGWSTDRGPTAITAVGEDGNVRIPFLLNAENIQFERNGGIRKCGGAAKVNASELESGADIVGIYDAWFSGTTGSATQHRIINIGEKIKKDDANGTFTDLFTSLSAGAIPCYAMLNDLLIIGLHSSDTPKSWDGSTAQALAGSPPNFGVCIVHGNRLWATDVWSAPSYVYYSPYLDAINATGEGWGRIAIDPDDGDIVTGLASHRGELIVFKGPYKGSIHRIQGSAPTGNDAFRTPPGAVTRGTTAAWHNLIFPFGNDLGFVTPTGQVQSLNAVEQYGDFDAIALNRDLKKFQSRINYGALTRGWAATNTDEDLVIIALPVDGSSTPNFVLVMDYYWNPPRFLQWPIHAATAFASGIDAAADDRRVFYAGGEGFLRKLNQNARNVDDDIAIDALATTPYLDYNLPFNVKTLGDGFLEFVPKNNGLIQFYFKQDSGNRQEIEVDQLAGDPLGTVPGMNFTLGISALAEASAVKRFFPYEGGGEFRQVQFEIENDTLNEDIEIHSFGATIEVGGMSEENDL